MEENLIQNWNTLITKSRHSVVKRSSDAPLKVVFFHLILSYTLLLVGLEAQGPRWSKSRLRRYDTCQIPLFIPRVLVVSTPVCSRKGQLKICTQQTRDCHKKKEKKTNSDRMCTKRRQNFF